MRADHNRLLHAVWANHRGVEVKTVGDAFFVAFAHASDAVAAAQATQHALRHHSWPGGRAVKVRIGVHRGSPQLRDGDYFGIDAHYAARLCATAHGGQVLLSETLSC